MFGEYFEKNDAEVREELYKWVSEGKEEIEGNIRIALRHKQLSMNLWIQNVLRMNLSSTVIYCYL